MRDPRAKHRAGAALVMVMVCLVVVMSLLGSMLAGTLQARRQLRLERDRRQCELLLEAAVLRAKRRVAADKSIAEETWTVAASEITGTAGGVIRLSAVDSTTEKLQVQVVAEYPAGGPWSIRRSRIIQIDKGSF